MLLPIPRGPLSNGVVTALRSGSFDSLPTDVAEPIDALADDDLQLALWVCFELYYRGFENVADHWEWEPELIAFRRLLEDITLVALRSATRIPSAPGVRVADRLRDLIAADDGPSVARFIQSQAGPVEFAELVCHRSVYQLKEADPHTWAIPRLQGRAKAALVEIQTDEYGNGELSSMHSELFRSLLIETGLDANYGAYLDNVPGITLAISNVMSLFGLRRELRGALVGHLAAYEMTSSEPCRRYAQGLRRLGGTDEACAFYDVHVTADALHEQLAAYDLCEGLADDEPELTEDILFGAAACLHVDNRFAQHVLEAWAAGRSSLSSATRPLAVAS